MTNNLVKDLSLAKFRLWLLIAYGELGYEWKSPTPAGQDNKEAICEHVEAGPVKLVCVGTDDMIGDFLTKALVGEKLRKSCIAVSGSGAATNSR